jgi:3-phenylpropionate/trans-cinnamate dioxygenase ferredoxin reductase subunit
MASEFVTIIKTSEVPTGRVVAVDVRGTRIAIAGATAVITLREEGVEGAVTLIGAEPEPPYERPPLSKSYLRGETPRDQTLVRPNRAQDLRLVIPIIKARRPVNLQHLQDESVDLRTLHTEP